MSKAVDDLAEQAHKDERDDDKLFGYDCFYAGVECRPQIALHQASTKNTGEILIS